MSAKRESDEEFLSVLDVAKRLQLSDETVRRWAAEGRLAAVRVGRQWRIYPHEVDRFLARATRSDAGEGGVWDPGRQSLLYDPEEN
jgi:excisionase family DNA binding protein